MIGLGEVGLDNVLELEELGLCQLVEVGHETGQVVAGDRGDLGCEGGG